MASRSYSNLLDLTSCGSPSSFSREKRRLPRVATVAGVLSELDDETNNSVGSDAPSSVSQERMIIVGNQLPVKAQRKEENGKWEFAWDEDSLLLQLKDGLGDDVETIYIGCLKEEIDPIEQDDVAQYLLDNFKCVPTFLPPELFTKFYHGFCKQHLWPLFHYMLPLSPDLGGRFDRSLWQAYVSVNKIFADKVMEVINPDEDFVWVHDYHLMVLPTFLRKRFNRARLGFFLHSPFPSSEIYRTLPVRDELLRALLNSDLIGFHTFDYARHFLSCCSRMLGIAYQSKRGYIGLEYYGRTVSIKILPVGIHIGQLESVMNLSETESKVAELRNRFKGQTVMLGVDDMDIFKGISLKLLAMEQLLLQHADKRGKVVLVQIANPARGRGKDVQEVQCETYATVKRINDTFGRPGYTPVILIDTQIRYSHSQISAFSPFHFSDHCTITRIGMAVMATIMNRQHLLTYIYLLVYISLSSGVILYNKWVLSTLYFNFPFPITLTMIHMAFSGGVAFFLIRVLKVVAPIKMTFHIYATCVVPISAFFAASLWFGNTAYLYISVAFIQMLKALMPVATFLVAVTLGTEKLRCDVFWNMILVSVGVVISSYGEIHFNVLGTVYQVSGIAAEALRLVLTQVLLQNKGLTLNPITSLYYIAPCSFVFLFIPWYILEKPEMEAPHMQFNFWIFFSNALCALALNFSTFLVIGRTGAVTIRVAGVLKDWLLISLSTVLFPESKITGLNVIGYAIALSGVVCYNYLKIRDVRTSLLQIIPDESAKELHMEKKADDDGKTNEDSQWDDTVLDSPNSHFDEEAPLMYSSRISHLGRKPA